NSLLFPPRLEQSLPAARVTGIRRREAGDAVGAEVAEILPELAPGDDDAYTVEEAERERPDDTLRGRAAPVAIGDLQLALGANGLAHKREVDIVGGQRRARPDQQRRGVDVLAQIVRQHRC